MNTIVEHALERVTGGLSMPGTTGPQKFVNGLGTVATVVGTLLGFHWTRQPVAKPSQHSTNE